MTRKEYNNYKWSLNHKINDKGTIERLCSICNEWKEENENYFYPRNKKKPERGFSGECILCAIKRSQGWRQEHPEEVEEYWRRQNEKGDVTRILYKRQAAKLSRERGHVKRWCQENPDRVKFYYEKRLHKNHKINKSEWLNCKKYFDYKCAYCGLPLTEHYFTRRGITKLGDFHKEHVDHEGNNDLSNCVPSCGSCNDKKWKFPLEMWYNEDNDNYSQERYDKIIQWITDDYKQYIEEYIPKRKYNRKAS